MNSTALKTAISAENNFLRYKVYFLFSLIFTSGTPLHAMGHKALPLPVPLTLLKLAAAHLQLKTHVRQTFMPGTKPEVLNTIVEEHKKNAIELLKKFDTLPKQKDTQIRRQVEAFRAYLGNFI